jgi:hypothetical protein
MAPLLLSSLSSLQHSSIPSDKTLRAKETSNRKKSSLFEMMNSDPATPTSDKCYHDQDTNTLADFSPKTPKSHNLPLSTQHRRDTNGVKLDIPSLPLDHENGKTSGVVLNPLLGHLFAISFLPYCGSDEVRDDLLPLSDGEYFHEMEFDLDMPRHISQAPEKLNDPLSRKEQRKKNKQEQKRKKSKKRLAKELKKSFAKSNHSDLSNATDDTFDTLAQTIAIEIQSIGVERQKLDGIKSTMKKVQNDAKKIIVETQKSNIRIAKLSKTIADLETKLNAAHGSLQREGKLVESNRVAVDKLHSNRQDLEKKSKNLDESINRSLSYVEQIKCLNFSSVSQSSGSNLDSFFSLSRDNSSSQLRSRAGTSDGSFMTANEIDWELDQRESISGTSESTFFTSPPLPRYVSTASTFTTPNTDGKPPLSPIQKLSSFMRVHDLLLSNEARDYQGKMEKTERSDLVSLDNNELRHHVLDALIQRGMYCATDEWSKWKADRATGKILSRRDPTEHAWNYAAGRDVLLWLGEFDQGYKCDLPVVKARGIIDASPTRLLELLVDSSKAKSYNKLSKGRTDEKIYQKGIETVGTNFKGEAKVVRSLRYVSLLSNHVEFKDDFI